MTGYKVAVLGPRGTFSDMAYMEYINNHKDNNYEPEFYSTIDEVFSAIKPGNCYMGIVPVENTLDGYVQRTLDLLLEKELQVIDENLVKVQFSLMANTATKEDIDKLYVQFKANGQCREFINSLKKVKIISTESNMESFYLLGEEKNAAAIVPAHIAKEAEGKYVIENVTDAGNNHTRFLVLRINSVDNHRVEEFKQQYIIDNSEQKVRIPVYIMPSTERPGILYEILKSFSDNNINLISIMSRPTKQELGTYNFYMEIDGSFNQLDIILATLGEINKTNDIKILGIYRENEKVKMNYKGEKYDR